MRKLSLNNNNQFKISNVMKANPSIEEMKSLSSDAINNEANVVVFPKNRKMLLFANIKVAI